LSILLVQQLLLWIWNQIEMVLEHNHSSDNIQEILVLLLLILKEILLQLVKEHLV